MTDLDEIIEYIHTAMQAVDEAHRASQDLKQDTNAATLDAFREKMRLLQERQEKLMLVLGNEEAFAVDELVDTLSLAFSGHRAEYRRTPRMRN